MLFFNTWGILNTFGVYQTYYESGQLFEQSSSNISWIGAIQAFMVLIVGAFVGPLYDRGHLRWLLIVGAFLIVFGHMMLSLCGEFWQCLLAQGFVIGIGGEFACELRRNVVNPMLTAFRRVPFRAVGCHLAYLLHDSNRVGCWSGSFRILNGRNHLPNHVSIESFTRDDLVANMRQGSIA